MPQDILNWPAAAPDMSPTLLEAEAGCQAQVKTVYTSKRPPIKFIKVAKISQIEF